MKRKNWKSIFSVALVGVILSPLFVQAQDQGQQYPDQQQQYPDQGQGQQQQDPPGRAARLTYEQGAVSLQTSGADQWSDAGKNYPLTSGDRVYVDNGGRAEIQAGQTAIRLSSATDLTITNLTDQLTQFGLAQGTVRLRTYGLDPQSTVELDTPNGAITVVRPGDIRVDSYNGDGGTVITVNTGSVQVSGPSLSQEIAPGQSVRLTGDNPVQLTNVKMPGYDDFDRFSIDRDRRILNSQSARYVSRDVVGYDDLDENGSWNNSGEAGPVWYPNNVPEGWAPYHDGHWAYVQPWGWTWVDNASWGFAPFHYGRWSYYGNRWGWVPGPVAVVPVYSPALVVFVGGIGIGFGGGYGGTSAWFPLGVGEPYVPWYRCSPRYVRQVNVTNINITNIHNTTVVNNYNTFINNTKRVTNVNNINTANIRYAHQQNGVTAVAARDFAAGRPVAQSALKINPTQLRQAKIERQGPAQVQPTQTAIARPVTHAAPPVAIARPVVLTKRGPQVAMPGARPLANMPAKLGESRPGQVTQGNQTAQPRPGQTAVPLARPGQTTVAQPANGGRPGQPVVNQGARPGQPVVTNPGQPVITNQGGHPGQPTTLQQTPRPGQPATGQQGQPIARPITPAPGSNNAPRPVITRNPPPANEAPIGNRLPPPNRNGGNVAPNQPNLPNNVDHPAPQGQRPAITAAPVRPQYSPQQQNQVRPQYEPPQRPAPVQQNQQQVQQQQVQRPAPEQRPAPAPQNEVRPQYQPPQRPAAQNEQQIQRPAPEQRPAPQNQPRPQYQPPPPQERPQPRQAPEPRQSQPAPPQAYSRPAPQQQYRPAPQQAQQYRPAPQPQPQPQPQYRPAPQQQYRPAPQQQQAQQYRPAPQPQQNRPAAQPHVQDQQKNDARHDGRPSGR